MPDATATAVPGAGKTGTVLGFFERPKQVGSLAVELGQLLELEPTAGILGTLVLFGSAEDAVAIGEEKDGVKVLEIMSIWRVRLAHRGGEYEVDLLDRRSGIFDAPRWQPGGETR